MSETGGFFYTPFRDLKTQSLFGFYCASALAMEHQRGVAQELVMPMDEDKQELAQADVDTLRHVITALTELLSSGARCMISLPIHFETLAVPRWRNAYVGLGLSIPRRLRQLLTTELCDLPAGVPQGRVLDIVSMLKPFAGAIVVRLPIATRNFAAFAGAGIQAASADLDALAGAPAEETFATIYRFSTGAQKARHFSYLHSVRTSELALAASAAGVASSIADAQSSTGRPPCGAAGAGPCRTGVGRCLLP
jgi:hypothetical protein